MTCPHVLPLAVIALVLCLAATTICLSAIRSGAREDAADRMRKRPGSVAPGGEVRYHGGADR